MSIIRTIGGAIIRNKSTIATVAGMVGVCGAGVLACRVTYKDAGKVINEAKEELNTIEEMSETATDKECNKAVKNVYISTAKKMCKVYAIPVGLGLGSMFLIAWGHGTLRKEYLMVGGAYKALTNDFDHYRDKVKAFVGDEKERNISTMKRPPKTVEVTNPETGEIEEMVDVDLEAMPTDRSVFFDETCQPWLECGGDPERLKHFLWRLQQEAQEEYDKKGYLLLNWVYKRLDVAETYAGAHCGWLKGMGPDNIDFGIFNIYSTANRRFVNGLEDVVLLTFNDHGYIADKI